MKSHSVSTALLVAALGLAGSAIGQWDPTNGDWSKEVDTDLRVMTWNILDGINTQESKVAGLNQWEALARIVASMQPDVLILQEVADTGGGVDSVANTETCIDLFMYGGNDPFNGNAPVTAYVQLYAPSYDLPHVVVSTATDGFNRNVMMSRYPFSDLNGDGVSTYPDFIMLADLYATTGNGEIRGYGIAEIDLPDATYNGDLIMGNSHLKAGSSGSDHQQRIDAAQRIAYVIDALFNGLGTATADPNSKILNPAAAALPSADTVVITGGDWNEDEVKNGATKGPADWIVQAATAGGSDGTDRDRSDMTYDASQDLFTASTSTIGTSKLDYLAWQDSIAQLRRSWVFNSSTLGATADPPELAGFPINPGLASGLASDHRPVIADFILPLACEPAATDLGFAKAGTGGIFPTFEACGELSTGNTADLNLRNAFPGSPSFLIISVNTCFVPYSLGTIVPCPDILLGPVNVDGNGEILLPGFPGGGGPFDLYMQWLIFDPGAVFGKALSNGLEVHFLP